MTKEKQKNYLSKEKNISEKPNEKKLYHLVFNTMIGIFYYNLFIENDLIIKIELIPTDQKYQKGDYLASLCFYVSKKISLPCTLEIFNKWLIVVLNELIPRSLIDYNIHLADLRKTKEKQPNRKEKRRKHRLKKDPPNRIIDFNLMCFY